MVDAPATSPSPSTPKEFSSGGQPPLPTDMKLSCSSMRFLGDMRKSSQISLAHRPALDEHSVRMADVVDITKNNATVLSPDDNHNANHTLIVVPEIISEKSHLPTTINSTKTSATPLRHPHHYARHDAQGHLQSFQPPFLLRLEDKLVHNSRASSAMSKRECNLNRQ